MRVRLWFPEDPDAAEIGDDEVRCVEVDMPALPREGEIVSFDDLRPDHVYRVASVWWNLASQPAATSGDVFGAVTEVSAHLVFDDDLTAALNEVSDEGESGGPGEIDWANVVTFGHPPRR